MSTAAGPTNDYSDTADEYGRAEFTGTMYLAFRDVPWLISQCASGSRALDYGCGAGRSSRLLKRLGYEVTGIDISDAMLEAARELDPGGDYRRIEGGRIPLPGDSVDLAFSSLVFFEIPTLEGMTEAAAEIRRVLKPGGVFVLLIGAERLYDFEWLTVKVDYPENRNCQPGNAVRVFLTEVGLELTDYYWTDADYRTMFADAGLQVVRLHQPMGSEADGYPWINEHKVPSFSIYVARK
ncbi:class I SAM-dependent methyltransferase [Emcibacter sp. SYSU 3D8]|uniref:class I SAM-dependent methyltransferase n=1 Tax=Emcibacter sp. SYSU 3D8 TaxID=3133969 RepID=UPI0031FEEA0D